MPRSKHPNKEARGGKGVRHGFLWKGRKAFIKKGIIQRMTRRSRYEVDHNLKRTGPSSSSSSLSESDGEPRAQTALLTRASPVDEINATGCGSTRAEGVESGGESGAEGGESDTGGESGTGDNAAAFPPPTTVPCPPDPRCEPAASDEREPLFAAYVSGSEFTPSANFMLASDAGREDDPTVWDVPGSDEAPGGSMCTTDDDHSCASIDEAVCASDSSTNTDMADEEGDMEAGEEDTNDLVSSWNEIVTMA